MVWSEKSLLVSESKKLGLDSKPAENNLKYVLQKYLELLWL